MLDFFDVECKKDDKKKEIVLYPSFYVKRSKDLMIKGHSFYAIWDEINNTWSTDERRACEIIDSEIDSRGSEVSKDIRNEGYAINKMKLSRFKSRQYTEWKNFCSSVPDHFTELDSKIIFDDQKTSKTDYSSKRLSYSLCEGDCNNYEELMSTLYSPQERDKIEWAIGSIIAGDSKQIQKFIVFYGDPGSGKSTVLNIISMLFENYCTTFDAKSLGMSTSSFSLEPFKNNPLIAIQHDGDLSKIEDNTKLNSIVAHESLIVNEKHKTTYAMRFNTMLFIGTNEPVKITDSRSGIIRRLLDVNPSGQTLPIKKYMAIMERIPFELGEIANHCYHKYMSMGKNYYQNYKPIAMLGLTNDFYNFIDDNLDFFIENSEYIPLGKIWDKYKQYCDEAGVLYKLPMRAVRREVRSYYKNYTDRWNGLRKVFFDFKADKFNYIFEKEREDEDKPYALSFDQTESLFDTMYKNYPAQYANSKDKPSLKWDDVTTKLKDIDTHMVHYVLLPDNHIVIDFDLKNDKGEKDFEMNLEAASKWPPTYAELSKSGGGIHLHYIYEGDASELRRFYAEDIEVKVFTGNSSLRRRLSKCNNLPIEKINSGLPKKGAKKVVNQEVMENEAQLRGLIRNCLAKKHHGHTKPEVDYIYSELEKAYKSGMHYDVRDLHKKVAIFASKSNNQSIECMKLVSKMKFCSADCADPVEDKTAPIVFFDCEVFQNLFVICWMFDDDDKVSRMVNPSPEDVQELFKYNLVGFNNRRYDNHILYARATRGYSNEELYELSQKIINGKKGENSALFNEAYNLSYTDIYDFASTKQGLKKWEIELGIHHQENEYPWDKPVPEDKWEEVVDYCCNDVRATKMLFHHLSADFNARKILAELTGLTPNATNLQIITKMIVGSDKNPPLVYTDLSETFPGYEFVQDDKGWHNMYRGTDLGFGGYVYAEPGMYRNVALLDVNNMHGASIDLLNKFGIYTQNYRDLRAARIAIKHREYDRLKDMFDGKFMKYVGNDEEADNLQQALKLVLNSTYGIAAATFSNPLKDPRDKNNTIALRGALFMRTLQDEVVKRGFTVAHIKTDSIKIPDATDEIIKFVQDFAQQYGYEMEHEVTYRRMCLVNDAVYIAQCDEKGIRNKGGKDANKWKATGAEFQVPFVFKTLFSHEKLEFKDFCETKSVMKGELYLDFNENLPEDEHDYKFVGKVGQFCPVKPGEGGGILYRVQDNKYYAAAGTKGFRWLESESIRNSQFEDKIDMEYFNAQADSAIEHISEFGDFEQFTSDDDMSWLYVPDGVKEEVPFEESMNPPENNK